MSTKWSEPRAEQAPNFLLAGLLSLPFWLVICGAVYLVSRFLP